MTCQCGCLSPFLYWKHARSSIFLEGGFGKAAKSGKTVSQICSKTVHDYEQTTGVSLGSVYGISARADKYVTARQDQQMAKRKKARA